MKSETENRAVRDKTHRIYSLLSVIVAALLLNACGYSAGGGANPSARAPDNGELPTGEQGGVRKIGKPYQIAGLWYYPKDDPDYDERGYASWYGPDFHGKKTANGEVYNMNALTAAHKTLPLPSFVKVTNLENGRTIVLRVNDRGPFAKGRIIDISRRGAQLLGFEKQGVTQVRVQISDENGRVLASKHPDTPKRNSSRVQVATNEGHYVQIGSFSDQDNAKELADRANQNGQNVEIVRADTPRGVFWRVRVGPFESRTRAERVLDQLVADGFYEARIFKETS